LGEKAMRLAKLLVAVVTATALLAVGVGGASARRLSISSQTWKVSFTRFEWYSGFVRIRCPVTLEGSMHARTFAKVAGSLVGYVTSATKGTCTLNEATVLTETLPWHVRYSAFNGFLPAISQLALNVIGVSIRGREAANELTCLSQPSTAERPVRLTFPREARGAFTEPVVSGEVITGAECAGFIGRYSNGEGTAAVTAQGSSSRITLTLI
jgi:hypothetical protein